MPKALWLSPFIAAAVAALGACAAMQAVGVSHPRSASHIVHAATGGQGSGTLIAPDTLVTAAHVVDGAETMTVGDVKLPATVARVDKENDIAVLNVPGLACPCVPLAAHDAALDEAVVVIGFPANNIVGRQIVTRGTAQGNHGNRLVLEANVVPGNSGGGVFVFRDGHWQMVGVLVEVTCVPAGFFGCSLATYLSRAVSWAATTKFLAGA